MKRLALAAVAALVVVPAFAADPPKPAGLNAARQAFVAALKAKNWTALADQVSWPVAIEGYEAPSSITKAAYLKDHKKLTNFIGDDAETLKCIAGGAATWQGDKSQFGFGSWNIDCNGNEFYFGVKSGKVLFTGYQNINE